MSKNSCSLSSNLMLCQIQMLKRMVWCSRWKKTDEWVIFGLFQMIYQHQLGGICTFMIGGWINLETLGLIKKNLDSKMCWKGSRLVNEAVRFLYQNWSWAFPNYHSAQWQLVFLQTDSRKTSRLQQVQRSQTTVFFLVCQKTVLKLRAIQSTAGWHQRWSRSFSLSVSTEIKAPVSYNCSEQVAPRTNYRALAAAAKVISSPHIRERETKREPSFLRLTSVAFSIKWAQD